MSRKPGRIGGTDESIVLIEQTNSEFAQIYQVLAQCGIIKPLRDNLEVITKVILQIISLAITEGLPVNTILENVLKAGEINAVDLQTEEDNTPD